MPCLYHLVHYCLCPTLYDKSLLGWSYFWVWKCYDYQKRWPLLAYQFPFYPILGILFIFRNSLQGLGKKLTPKTSSFIELFGKILFVVFVILYMGYLGVILCEPLLWIPMTIQLYFSLRNTPDVCLSARSPFSLIQSPFISYLFHNYFLRHNAKSKHIS